MSSVLLHCADPRLGRLVSERERDRLAAFERFLTEAASEGATAVLVSGRLLAPSPPDPELLARLETALGQVRDAGVSVWTTCEDGERGWLRYLTERGLVAVLAVRPDTALPIAEPAAGVRLVGLGRPRDVAELADRVGLIGKSPRAVATVALLHGGFGGDAHQTLAQLGRRTSYAALGGGPAVSLPGPVVDPGPLLRGALDEADPGFARIQLRGTKATIERRPSDDRPLLRVRIAATAPAAARKELLTALTTARSGLSGRPLLRIELASEALELNDQALLDAARDAIDPVVAEVHRGAETSAGFDPRRALEREVLDQIAMARSSDLGSLPAEVFDHVLGDGDGVAAATAAIATHVGCVAADLEPPSEETA